jgi:hypothetical protein
LVQASPGLQITLSAAVLFAVAGYVWFVATTWNLPHS